MFSKAFILKLLGTAASLLPDNCLEPHIGQEDGNGDFDYFAQKIGRNLPPTEQQANAVSLVSSILDTLYSELSGVNQETEEMCKDLILRIWGYDLDRDDYVSTPKEVYEILIGFKGNAAVNEVMKRALAEWIAEKVTRLSDNDLWERLDAIYDGYNTHIEERDEHFSLLSSPAQLEQSLDLKQLRTIKKIVEDSLSHCHGYDL